MRDRRAVWIASAVVALGLAGVVPAMAQGGGNGSPPGAPPNAHGLCTAAANGQKNGKPWQDGAPKPFENLHDNYLESAASESSDQMSSEAEGTRADIIQDCNDAGVPIGGNPSSSSS